MRKILIANRGEIALRVMRTARKMGINTVAVFSDADRNARHVRYADEAIHIGSSLPSESYLNIEKIIAACIKTNADAVHPGYGFLSENSEFAEVLSEHNIKLIGPSAQSMRIMGNKIAAKKAVLSYNIPQVPGLDRPVESVSEAIEIARKIGYPILIKASAGGGGKGMRIVEKEEELSTAIERASSEALASFGNPDVFIEKYVLQPRHIEIQIIADQHGNYLHVFERECSIQRRHQKVIEEAPSAILTEEIRKAMGQAAINVAKSCDYEGAGTVEFLMDKDLNFYFLEMNTRLQVEHPVTEMISGLDLVEQQIRIAKGEKLSIRQEDLKIKGHALELRVFAEDPKNDFLPSIGKLKRYKIPNMEMVRVDDAFEEGQDIPIYYDPMIAKLAVWGKDRISAIDRMLEAINQYKILGIETTLDFGRYAFNHEAFRSGNFDTNFVKDHFRPEDMEEELLFKAGAYVALKHFIQEKSRLSINKQKETGWNNRNN